MYALEQADGGDLSVLVGLLYRFTRIMIRFVLNDAEEAAVILGAPLPPDELTMGDYPGLRQRR